MRLELRCCGFTRRERTAAQARLDRLIAEHAERERELDTVLAALDNSGIGGAA